MYTMLASVGLIHAIFASLHVEMASILYLFQNALRQAFLLNPLISKKPYANTGAMIFSFRSTCSLKECC